MLKVGALFVQTSMSSARRLRPQAATEDTSRAAHTNPFAALWLLVVSTAPAQRLSPLASAPDWSKLEAFQETITREEFVELLDHVYAPGGAAII